MTGVLPLTATATSKPAQKPVAKPAPKTPRKTTTKPRKIAAKTDQSMLAIVLDSAELDKALDCVTIPLAGKSAIADYIVVLSGTSARHVVSICENMQERLKQNQVVPRIEGKAQGDWVLVDAGDIIVHIFRPEVREFYQLEKMWLEGAEVSARPPEALLDATPEPDFDPESAN